MILSCNNALSDHKVHVFPFATSERLEPQFYKDIADCNLAVFSTHGGPIHGTLQLRSELDRWFSLSYGNNKLGQGICNYVFLASCSMMGYFNIEKDAPKPLETDWMNGKIVSGLRMACGFDGNAVTGGRNGWRYYGWYNKGDSISDSWCFSGVDDNDINDPVSVSYGTTASDAIANLADGRFLTVKVESKFAASSEWKSIKE